LQVGDTGPVESARRSNSRVLGSPFSGLSGQPVTFKMTTKNYFFAYNGTVLFEATFTSSFNSKINIKKEVTKP
jgi:hypothetical protein